VPSINWNKKMWMFGFKKFLEEPGSYKFYGEKWGDPEQRKKLTKIKAKFLTPFINENHTALEIGPGGGRWTQYLLKFKKLYLLDLNSEFFPYLKKRFGDQQNISYHKTNGADFPNIPKNSVDFLFSFGTFVHLDQEIILEYLDNMKDILKENSSVVLNYSDLTKPKQLKWKDKGDRGYSYNTRAIMTKMIIDRNYEIVSEDIRKYGYNLIHFKPVN